MPRDMCPSGKEQQPCLRRLPACCPPWLHSQALRGQTQTRGRDPKLQPPAQECSQAPWLRPRLQPGQSLLRVRQTLLCVTQTPLCVTQTPLPVTQRGREDSRCVWGEPCQRRPSPRQDGCVSTHACARARMCRGCFCAVTLRVRAQRCRLWVCMCDSTGAMCVRRHVPSQGDGCVSPPAGGKGWGRSPHMWVHVPRCAGVHPSTKHPAHAGLGARAWRGGVGTARRHVHTRVCLCGPAGPRAPSPSAEHTYEAPAEQPSPWPEPSASSSPLSSSRL